MINTSTQLFTLGKIKNVNCLYENTNSSGVNKMIAHIHYNLMALYAQDAAETDKPWERWQFMRKSSSSKNGLNVSSIRNGKKTLNTDANQKPLLSMGVIYWSR